MPLYDFICSEGHIFEKFAGYDDSVVECPQCESIAVRIPINHSQSIITETGVKDARRAEVPPDEVNLKPRYDLYREAAQELEYKYGRLSESAGKEITPPLARMGISKAHRLKRMGVTVSDFRKQRTS